MVGQETAGGWVGNGVAVGLIDIGVEVGNKLVFFVGVGVGVAYHLGNGRIQDGEGEMKGIAGVGEFFLRKKMREKKRVDPRRSTHKNIA